MELNEEYKKRHKPLRQTEKQRHHQGYFTPTVHPEKCLTRINEFRSLWELYFMEWADRCDDVLRWASEPIYIEYRNPLANKKYCDENHLDWRNPIYWKLQKYHVDFWIELRGKNGQGVRKIFIEVKPYNQSVPPKMPAPNAKASEFRSYNHLAEQFLVNNQKWQAAKKFCEERGTEFIVVTEVTLKKLGILH